MKKKYTIQWKDHFIFILNPKSSKTTFNLLDKIIAYILFVGIICLIFTFIIFIILMITGAIMGAVIGALSPLYILYLTL